MTATGPVPIFLETDLFADVDDVGALAALMALQRNGECRVLGVGVNTPSRWGPPAARAVLQACGGDGIPVGRHAAVSDELAEHDYASRIALHDGETARPATDLLVEVLRAASEPIVVVSIGFLTNLLAVVADHADLVASRVARLVIMGGAFPEGPEFNVSTFPDETAELLERWPTPVDLVGFETADDVITGADLAERLPSDHPVRRAYQAYCGVGNGRPSWDPLTVLLAVRPDWDAFAWSEPGELRMDGPIGRWDPRPDGRHRHARRRVSAEAVRQTLDPLLAPVP